MKPTKKPKWLAQIDMELLDAVLNNPYDCFNIVDKNGILRFMSRVNAPTYEIEPEQALGKHYIEGVRFGSVDQVLSTGKAEFGSVIQFPDEKRIISRIPIKDSYGDVIGAVAKIMFNQTDQLEQLYQKIGTLEKNLRYYLK